MTAKIVKVPQEPNCNLDFLTARKSNFMNCYPFSLLSILFRLCNSTCYPQTSCSILLYRKYPTNLVVYYFGGIWHYKMHIILGILSKISRFRPDTV